MAYVTRDGQRVAQSVAYDFDRMDAAFRAAWNLDMLVSSGTRTTAEQEAIFRARYVTAGGVNGRRVYDTRWWRGVLWYRISAAGTVAVPGTSNHEENGPIGPRALDVRDSGGDPGVTRAGTRRSNWLRDNAGKFNFKTNGLSFGEPWHIEWTGSNPHGTPSTGGGGVDAKVQREQNWLISQGYNLGPAGADGIAGPLYRQAVKDYQTFLRKYGYTGPIDGDWGNGTQAAHEKRYAEVTAPKPQPTYPVASVDTIGQIGNVEGLQKIARIGGYKGRIDNQWGPGSKAGFANWLRSSGYGTVANWLRRRWGYVGNDQQGPIMTAALQRANAENNRVL